MAMVWVALGAAAAGLVFALYPWPAPGMRLKNAAWFVVAAAASFIAWLFRVDAVWCFAAAWYATLLLLQLSQRFVAPGKWVVARVLCAVGLVILFARLLLF